MRRISRKSFKREVSCSGRIGTIPRDLVTEVLARVASSSVKDMFNAKLSCKFFNKIAEDTHIYRHVSVDKFPVIEWEQASKEQRAFLNKCRDCENSEILYREALVDIVKGKRLEAAMKSLERAMNLGHTEAKYLMCIMLVFSGDDVKIAQAVSMVGDMKKLKNWRRKLRFCRDNFLRKVKTMWVKNPIFRRRPICCPVQDHSHLPETRKNRWNVDKEESFIECEACIVDSHIKFFCDRINVV